MNPLKLVKILDRKPASPSVNVEADVNTKVETSREEFQGSGKIGKVIAKNKSTIFVDNRHITLLLPRDIPDKETNPDAYEKLKNDLYAEFQKGDVQFVERQANQDMEDYNKSSKELGSEEIIETLKGVVPAEDLLWMQTGLYVRFLNNNEKHDDAKRIRENASRNSQRARNIINLASAGFLEEYIIPICKEDDKFSAEQYDEIVEEMPGFIFVNSQMTTADVMARVDEKIENKEKYHWEVENISVNGLNHCVKTILDVKELISKKYPALKLNYRENKLNDLARGELIIEFK